MSEARRRRALALALAAVLVAIGAAAGVAIDRLALGRGDCEAVDRRGPPDLDELLGRYRDRLGLDAGQAAAVRDILARRWREIGSVLERVDPELDAIRRQADDQVRSLLRPDQRPRLDQLRSEFDARRAAMRSRLRGARPSR